MNSPVRFDIDRLRSELTYRIEALAIHLLSSPNGRLSDRRQLRFGNKGSFLVNIAAPRVGTYYDFEQNSGGDAFCLIQKCLGLSFPEALAWARDWCGLVVADRPHVTPDKNNPTDEDRVRRAERLWDEAAAFAGTLTERYLNSRRIRIDLGKISAVRHHTACPWREDDGSLRYVPAMVCAMTDISTGQLRAVLRTALNPDGSKIDKRMLGPSKGTAIKLSEDSDVTLGLGVTEGVENGLSILAQGWRPVWALGSAGSIQAFPVLPGIEHLTIFADHDDVGLTAARSCAKRWHDAGRGCQIVTPLASNSDWNDVVREARHG